MGQHERGFLAFRYSAIGDLTSSSGLTKAKDSITDLKKKSSKINQHVQTLKNECSALCENLELRHEEAEQLENYCNLLEESCRKVKSVEEAEIKTNAMKQNYSTLEEKLHYLYREVQEHFGKREKQLQDLEQRVTASIAKHTAEASLGQAGLQGAGARTETTQQSDLNKDIATLLISIRGLQLTMEMDAQKLRSGKEVAVLGTQQMKEIVAALAEIRDSIVQLHAKYEREILSHKNEHMTVFHTSTRFDSFLSQWERTQKEQRHMMENIQELQANMDGIYSLVKRISSSYGQTRSELDAFWQMKPLLEEVSRHLTIMRIQDTTEISAPRNSSFNINTIKQVIDQALSPLLEEMKSCNQHNTCTNCQSMQKKILDLEGQMAEEHRQAVVLCSDLRLVQDDAITLQNMLLSDRMKNEAKPVLDNITIKICSLQEQLSKLCLNKYSPLLEASNTISPGPCSCLERNDQCDDDTTKE
ncbi:testis-specific serine kinase substrate-like isoform X2 [Ascaphus truei]|uniref:testis-specific serine kinase substrate-like isoform X2 n=1 Tax=Ascaphus truei TaxID=8439 RepID=UPI003F5A4940